MKRSAQSGFTLIEILVALVVLAILSIAAYGGLNSLIKTREITKANDRGFHQLQLAMATISRDLQQATMRPIRLASGQIEPAMTGGTNDIPALTFTRAGWPNPLLQPRSSLQRIAYTVDNGNLIRLIFPVLDRVSPPEPARQVLLSNVRSIGFAFMGENGKPDDNWPPLNAEPGSYDRRLPIAIEITLDTKHWGVLQRLITIAP